MISRLLYLGFLFFAVACGNSDAPSASSSAARQITSIQWVDSVRNLGKIMEGQKVAVSFRFRNSGNKPLIIESVQPSCGCTVADYPKEPIAPGAEGEISGTFNSEGREGLQHKELTVRANTQTPEQKVYFEVDVQKKSASSDPGEAPHQ